jgi:hypothetical protein
MSEFDSVRAKVYVSAEARNAYDKGAKVLTLNAVTRGGDDNKQWASATPSLNLTMTVRNGDAAEFFELGEDYYLTFTRVPKAE